MSDDDLVCAACSGRVADGRCPTCRAAWSQLRPAPVRPETFLLLAGVAFALLVLLALVA